uniref:FAD-dependent oxidoreductase n=1 Tax=Algoriphagus sp. TaxID=1872435 RepID=UPI0040475AF0
MKVLVVGAGFSGAVIARELAVKGVEVVIIDKRSHIGGNSYDYVNEIGITVHKYGPHFFHTNNKVVFDYLSQFTSWIPYKHKVKAQLNDGKYVTLPVNRETKEIVGEENLIDTFVRPYSEKMWGMRLEQIDPQIINRVPFRDDNNELYFPDDKFQFMPKEGYTKLFHNILNHPSIEIRLNTKFNRGMEDEYNHIFNSMPIDEYYDFELGELAYRSIKFNHVNVPSSFLLPTAQVNFTNNGKFTRIVEWKKIPGHGVNNEMTTLTYEEPCDYKENNLERYYPVKDLSGENSKLFNKYKSIKNEKITFIGRLGMYVYLDMHQTINSSLITAKKFIAANQL